jgi:hypothetical protein
MVVVDGPLSTRDARARAGAGVRSDKDDDEANEATKLESRCFLHGLF